MPPGISGSTASTARRLDDDREVEAIPQKSPSAVGRSVTGRAPVPTAAQDAHASSAAREALANMNDRILYVGMNAASMKAERDALAKTGKPIEHVFSKEGATVKLDEASYDLTDPTQIDAFANALTKKHALPETTSKALAMVLEQASKDGRDELAQIATVWARGEAGGSIPSRLVVSGHHAGGGFSGLRDASLFALARALPKAARQIEDFHFAGCMSEEHVNVRDEIRHAFPNLKTVWGYSGYSPEAPVHHLMGWERATRGHAGKIDKASVPAQESAVAWSAAGGVVGKQKPLDVLRSDGRAADGRFESYKSGLLPSTWVTNDDYAAYQAIAQSKAPKSERDDAAAKAAVLLRIRKYDHVREKFEHLYGARIRAACAKAGIEAPHFDVLSRKDALGRIETMKNAVAAFDPDLRTKLVGFADLDSNVIDESWCY